MLVVCGALISIIDGLVEVKCTGFDDRNHGFGCEVKDIKIQSEEDEIEFMAKHNKKNDSDIKWVQIKDSMLKDLPKNIFQKFVNLQKIMIINCTGLKNLDKEYFDAKLELVLIKNSDVEYVSDKVFSNLKNVQTISLNNNKIKKIHKDAFKDLIALEKIEMVFNEIEVLEEDLFTFNLNLKYVLLYNNSITILPGKLFSQNIKVENLLFQNNKIVRIDKSFSTSFAKLKKFDLSKNICIDKAFVSSSYYTWSKFENEMNVCYGNFENVKDVKKGLQEVKEELHVLTEEFKEEKTKTETDFKIFEDNLVNNSSQLQNYTSHLLNYWEKAKDEMEDKFRNDLKLLTLVEKSEIAAKIHLEIEEKVNAKAKANKEIFLEYAMAEKLKQEELETNVNDLRESKATNQTFIYFLLFTLIVFAIAFVLIIYKKTHLFSKFNSSYDANVQLI